MEQQVGPEKATAHPDLNQGPVDLRSAALTAELHTRRRHPLGASFLVHGRVGQLEMRPSRGCDGIPIGPLWGATGALRISLRRILNRIRGSDGLGNMSMGGL